jgi:hypothetical protein
MICSEKCTFWYVICSYNNPYDSVIHRLKRPERASPATMSSFHTDEYVHFLHRVTPETAEDLTYHGTRCENIFKLINLWSLHCSCNCVRIDLLGEDNPAFEGVFEFCSISAGGSICKCIFMHFIKYVFVTLFTFKRLRKGLVPVLLTLR